jgi:hypothetical protein
MTAATLGSQTKLSINGTVYEFQSCGIDKLGSPVIFRDGITGTIDTASTDARNGPCHVGGPVSLQPSCAQILALSTLAVAAANGTLTEFDMIVDRSYNIITYEDCKINALTLRGGQGGIFDLSLDIIGKTANTTGTVAAATITAPAIFADCVLTLGNAAYEVMSIDLAINNGLRSDRYANSLTLTDIPMGGKRSVTLQTVHAHTGATSNTLWNTTATPLAATNSLTINDGTSAVTFTFGALTAPRTDPPIDQGEVLLTKNWIATKTANTAAVAVA